MATKKTKTAAHGQKKKDVTITLTPDAVAQLDQWAQGMDISRSELIERMARGQIHLYAGLEVTGELCAV